MDEVSTGLRRFLEFPFVYSFFQKAIARRAIWPDLIEEFIPKIPENMAVLDIGCGPGNFLAGQWIKMAESDFVGIDPSSLYIDQAKRDFPNARFYVGTVSEMQLHNEKFDLVVISGVLHHVNDAGAQRIMDFAIGHTKNGGLAISVDPVLFPKQNRIAKWMALADRGQNVRSEAALKALWNSCQNLGALEVQIRDGYLKVPYNHVICVARPTNLKTA